MSLPYNVTHHVTAEVKAKDEDTYIRNKAKLMEERQRMKQLEEQTIQNTNFACCYAAMTVTQGEMKGDKPVMHEFLPN